MIPAVCFVVPFLITPYMESFALLLIHLSNYPFKPFSLYLEIGTRPELRGGNVGSVQMAHDTPGNLLITPHGVGPHCV